MALKQLLFIVIIAVISASAGADFLEFCTRCLTDSQHCTCSQTTSGRRSIDCNGPQNITEFPSIFRNEDENCTKYSETGGIRFSINIWGYNFNKIPANAINFTLLDAASFSVNFASNPSLEKVDPNAFASLKGGMNSLWFYVGGIHEIPFETLTNAEFSCNDGVGPDISFQFNQIAQIPVNKFEMLMQAIGCPFGDIYLGQNRIENLTAGSFSNVIVLGSLDLTGNQIVRIGNGAFKNVSIGNQLQLGYNNIQLIDANAFEMATIDWLDLSNNQLLEIPYDSAMKINFVGDRWLQLSNNLIAAIEPENFNAMLDGIGRSAINIDLSSNQITKLKTGTFRDLENSWIGLIGNTIDLTEPDAIRNVSFNSIFFLKLAANVTFAPDMFHAPVKLESYDISIEQGNQQRFNCISGDSVPNICGSLQVAISNHLYMEQYCADLLSKLDCFNRVTMSIDLPAGDPSRQYLTYLGAIPRTNSPLKSLELRADSSSAGICFDGSEINSHTFLLDWGSSEEISLFCTETLRSLKDVAVDVTLETFNIFQSIPSVFLEFPNLQRLTLEAPAKLNCTCEVAMKFDRFAQQVDVSATCLQNDADFNDWRLENYESCAQSNEKYENFVDVTDSDLCKSECNSFVKTTISTIVSTIPSSSIANLRIAGNVNTVIIIAFILCRFAPPNIT